MSTSVQPVPTSGDALDQWEAKNLPKQPATAAPASPAAPGDALDQWEAKNLDAPKPSALSRFASAVGAKVSGAMHTLGQDAAQLPAQYGQFARQRFQQLKADPLAPFKALGASAVEPVVQQAKDAATLARDYRGQVGPAPLFIGPNEHEDVAAMTRTGLNVVAPSALSAVGEAASPLVRRLVGAGADAVAPAAAETGAETAAPAVARDVAHAPATPAPTAAPAPEPVEMHSGLSLGSKQRTFAKQAYQGLLTDAYPQLNTAADQPLKAALNERGAAAEFGGHAANYYDALTKNVPAAKRAQFEQSVVADNMDAQAAKLGMKGDHENADKLMALSRSVRATLPASVASDPAYAPWLAKYKAVIEPEFERVARASGLPDQQFRQLPDNSAYIPLPGKLEAGDVGEGYTYRPPTRAGLRTKQSGAVLEAKGGGTAPTDFQSLIGSHMPGRQQVAANNAVVDAIRGAGRPLASADAPLADGESRIAFDDKNHLVTPESDQARHHVAVPKNQAEALAQSDARMAPKPPQGAIGKVGNALTRGVASIETHSLPAVLPIHARNIAETVGSQSKGVIPDALTAVTPGGSTLSGARQMSGVDFTDPATAKRMLSLARYGGLRQAETKPGILHAAGRALFGPAGVDPRGRAALAETYTEAHPTATPAEVARHVANELGNYVGANQPTGIRFMQKSGLTTFAPAATAFTRGAARRLALGGEGGAAVRLGRLARTAGSGLALAEGANYATTGHSTFSNPAGHRLDIDTGGRGPEGGHKYLSFSAADPLVSRALNQTGVRGLIEGEGVPGAARRAVNATLAHLGVAPRAGLALGLNVEPRLSGEGTAVVASPAQFDPNRQIRGAVTRAVGGMAGGVGALSGATSFSADQSVPERVASSFGVPVPYEDYRTKPGYKPEPPGFRDKTATAVMAIYKAKSADDRKAIVQKTIADAKAAGYLPGHIAQLRDQLNGAARHANHAPPSP